MACLDSSPEHDRSNRPAFGWPKGDHAFIEIQNRKRFNLNRGFLTLLALVPSRRIQRSNTTKHKGTTERERQEEKRPATQMGLNSTVHDKTYIDTYIRRSKT